MMIFALSGDIFTIARRSGGTPDFRIPVMQNSVEPFPAAPGSQDRPPSKRELVYRHYKPAFDFAYRIALDEDLARNAVELAFAESLMTGGGPADTAEGILGRIEAEAARFCVTGKKGSHFRFADSVDEDVPMPFAGRYLKAAKKGTDFGEAWRRMDVASRAVLAVMLAGIPSGMASKAFGLGSEGLAMAAAAAIGEISWAFEVSEPGEVCTEGDVATLRRYAAGTLDASTAADVRAHLEGGCVACGAVAEAISEEKSLLERRFGALPEPLSDVRLGMRQVLDLPDFASIPAVGAKASRKISREMGMLIALVTAAALIGALYLLTELLYRDKPDRSPVDAGDAGKNDPVRPSGEAGLKALFESLNHPDPAQRKAAEDALVARSGPAVLSEAFALARAGDPRTGESARRIVAGIAAVRAKEKADKIAIPKALKPAESAEFRERMLREMAGSESASERMAGYAGELESAGSRQELNRIHTMGSIAARRADSLRQLGNEGMDALGLERRTHEGSLAKNRLLLLSSFMTFEDAEAYLSSGEEALPWKTRARIGLSAALHLDFELSHPFEILAEAEKASGLPLVLDPGIHDKTVPFLKTGTRLGHVKGVLDRATMAADWTWVQAEGCIYVAPRGVTLDSAPLGRLTGLARDPVYGPYAAIGLEKLLGFSFGFKMDEPMNSAGNGEAYSSFLKWFETAGAKIVFDSASGRHVVKRG